MAIAFFYTWTTYGTWLPGDQRGWYHAGKMRRPDREKESTARLHMNDEAIRLSPTQRQLVESTIADHCLHRNWTLHAVNCRTNHVHTAITAPNRDITTPRTQFKSWCTRKLNAQYTHRESWWTQRGWDDYIDDLDALETIIKYIQSAQDDPPHNQ